MPAQAQQRSFGGREERHSVQGDGVQHEVQMDGREAESEPTPATKSPDPRLPHGVQHDTEEGLYLAPH